MRTACASLVGALMGTLMGRWFVDATVQTRSTVTIAMLVGLLAAGFRAFGDEPYPTPDLFGTASFQVAGAVLPIGTIMMIVSAITIAIVVSFVLHRARLGIDLRALAERPVAAELLGVPAGLLTVGVWAAAGAISGFAVAAIAPTRTVSFAGLALLILPGLAAALLGSFRSFSGTIGGGMLIGIIEGVASQIEAVSAYRSAISFFVILAGLLWMQRREVWDTGR